MKAKSQKVKYFLVSSPQSLGSLNYSESKHLLPSYLISCLPTFLAIYLSIMTFFLDKRLLFTRHKMKQCEHKICAAPFLLGILCLASFYFYTSYSPPRMEEAISLFAKTSNNFSVFAPILKEISAANDLEMLKSRLVKSNTITRSMIVTSWRSGSTFLGDILLAHPATFYHYEPLLRFGIVQIPEKSQLEQEATQDLVDLFHCDYSNMGNYW